MNGTQLLITATIDAAISSANMTVRFCVSPNGAMRLNAMIMPVTTIANGAALPSAVGRNRPRMRRVSDSNIVRNDGHASMQASTSVIWIGMNGNGTVQARQEERHQHRVDRLDEEHGGRAGHVVDDPCRPSSTTCAVGEIGVEQHDLRDLARGVRPGGDGDRAVGLAQGEQVIHAVAGHRD